MSARKCAGCNCNVYPDDSVEYPGFVLCLDCDADLVETEEEQYDDAEWSFLNATDDEEDFG